MLAAEILKLISIDMIQLILTNQREQMRIKFYGERLCFYNRLDNCS